MYKQSIVYVFIRFSIKSNVFNQYANKVYRGIVIYNLNYLSSNAWKIVNFYIKI